MEESFPRNEENALMTRCSPSQKIVKTSQRRVFPSHHCRRLEAVQELEERAEVSERLPSLERVARALELSPTMDELEEPRIKEEFKNIESAEEIDEGSGEDELEEESTGIAQGYISSSFARRSSHAQESLLQLRAQAPPQPSFPLRINPQSSSEPDAQHRRLSTPSPLRKTSAILVSSRTPSSFDLLQSPPSPPSAISQSSSDPTPRQPKDGAASSSIKPPFLFARQASRVCTPPPLRSSPTQTANPSSIQAIGLAQPAPTAPPTPSLVNSNRKRPFDPALLAPSKKRRSDHVSFLLPNDKENEHEAAMPSPTEVDLKGCKIVIGADVQDEQTREQLEEDVEALDGEISVRAVREDWEDDGEGIQVVLICWETSEGAEGSPAAREEVELVSRVQLMSFLSAKLCSSGRSADLALYFEPLCERQARETGACLHDPLWVSSLMEVLEERKSPSKSKQRRSKGRWLYKR
ncbi:hypothetical protein BDY24DRAFT_373191 [Mrakia frigida]|uniref:uncharacterized protein n=1 Tax=Mrakia frigida TaxID=29902 RepID=UPI003FCC213C